MPQPNLLELRALKDEGKRQIRRGLFVQALESLGLALSGYEKLFRDDTNKELLETITNKGVVMYQLGNYDQALKLFTRALNGDEQRKDCQSIISDLIQIACALKRKRNLQEATAAYKRALTEYEKIDGGAECPRTLQLVATAMGETGLKDKAEIFFNKALALFNRQGDVHDALLALLGVANVLTERGNYQEAVKLYYRALKGFEELGNVLYVGDTLGRLGTVFFAQQNFPKALEVYRKASNIFEGFRLYLRTGEMLHDMGEMYEAMGNLEECLDCYHAALDAFEMLDETTIKLPGPEVLSKLSRKTGRFLKTDTFQRRALAAPRLLDEDPMSSTHLRAHGQAYYNKEVIFS